MNIPTGINIIITIIVDYIVVAEIDKGVFIPVVFVLLTIKKSDIMQVHI